MKVEGYVIVMDEKPKWGGLGIQTPKESSNPIYTSKAKAVAAQAARRISKNSTVRPATLTIHKESSQ